jgi:hypothetical protein
VESDGHHPQPDQTVPLSALRAGAGSGNGITERPRPHRLGPEGCIRSLRWWRPVPGAQRIRSAELNDQRQWDRGSFADRPCWGYGQQAPSVPSRM